MGEIQKEQCVQEAVVFEHKYFGTPPLLQNAFLAQILQPTQRTRKPPRQRCGWKAGAVEKLAATSGNQ
ncbi:hypothetical protein GCM10007338_11440 [Corynebacterium pelargi]|uniref:Uncharacterized protein n=1 Tax=Corynebacterium pelargi TaxID=1471400 RepID=A0A410WAL8_9CORY|nr:hypothetical protein CPELA_08710 [Corynebacterium pelargi]GGG75548.1 hypothetical protein GCM10007338_11440 [Corynebacterium pelargi]